MKMFTETNMSQTKCFLINLSFKILEAINLATFFIGFYILLQVEQGLSAQKGAATAWGFPGR